MITNEAVRQVVEPLLAERDIELIKVDFLKNKGKYRLILTVDKFTGNISLDELAEVSNFTGALIDEKGLIDGSYDLEVNSPGVERPLVKIGDYERFKGKKAKLVFNKEVDGQFFVKGEILDVKGNKVVIKADKKVVEIDLERIKRANLVYDIREDLK